MVRKITVRANLSNEQLHEVRGERSKSQKDNTLLTGGQPFGPENNLFWTCRPDRWQDYQIHLDVAKNLYEHVEQDVSSGLDVGLMAKVFSGLEVILCWPSFANVLTCSKQI